MRCDKIIVSKQNDRNFDPLLVNQKFYEELAKENSKLRRKRQKLLNLMTTFLHVALAYCMPCMT